MKKQLYKVDFNIKCDFRFQLSLKKQNMQSNILYIKKESTHISVQKLIETLLFVDSDQFVKDHLIILTIV